MTMSRLAGAAALAFVPVAAAATGILRSAGLPATSAGPAEVAAFYAGQPISVGIASALAPLAWLLLVLFGAGAVGRLRPAEAAQGEAWSLVGLAGIVMQNVLFAGSVAAQIALLAGAPAGGGLWQLHNALFSLNGIALAIAMLGFSISGLRTGTLAGWHVTVGLVAATLQLISSALTPVSLSGGPAGFALVGLVGFLLWLVWLVTFGVVLLREPTPDGRRYRGASPSTTSAASSA